MVQELLTLEDAISLNKIEIRDMHKKYGNPGIATLLGMLDFDKHFVKALGVNVWDKQGNEYLDFLGGYGSLNTGHNHPRIVEALDMVKDMPTLLQASLPPLAGALARNLALITPGNLERTFFCNSGAEAVEGALKLARAATGKSNIIYCHNSFHGKTMGALSVTGREKYQRDFLPLLPGCHPVSFGDAQELDTLMASIKPAAFIVEPIQGEGGIIEPPPGYLSQAREICKKHGTLLIVDEIQTGLGRTGKMFACEHENIVPDILCLAKSLGGGVSPLGAFITSDAIWKKAYGSLEKVTLHSSTFGGNTRAVAAGLASLEVIYDENLITKAEENGHYFKQMLINLQIKHPLIKEVRGKGLLIGIEFSQPEGISSKISLGLTKKLSEEYLASLIAAELMNNHRIITAYTLNNPNVIRLEPPLNVTKEQLKSVCSALDQVLSKHKSFLSVAASGVKTFIKSMR